MSENVVSLFGAPLPQASRPASAPVESVVRELERLLDLARQGEVIGFAGAFQGTTRVVGYSFAGAVQGYAMLGGLDCVRQRLIERALDADRT